MKNPTSVFVLLTAVILTLSFTMTCDRDSSTRNRRITTAGLQNFPPWTAEEAAKDVAARVTGITKEASTHLIRIRTAEGPHIHKEHDTVVFILSGAGRLHMNDQVFSYKPGDVVEIPRGVPHWAENAGGEATIVYAVFTPPYDGKDRLAVEAAK